MQVSLMLGLDTAVIYANLIVARVVAAHLLPHQDIQQQTQVVLQLQTHVLDMMDVDHVELQHGHSGF